MRPKVAASVLSAISRKRTLAFAVINSNNCVGSGRLDFRSIGLMAGSMTARSFFLSSVLLLAACSSQAPYDELGICLADTEDLNELKFLANRLASTCELELDDYFSSVKRDLETLDGPLASEHLFALPLEDPRWQSQTGLVMINNIGTSSPKAVGVSLFRNDALLGSNQNTELFRRDFVAVVSARWKTIDTPKLEWLLSRMQRIVRRQCPLLGRQSTGSFCICNVSFCAQSKH